jgi:hypothetical protein
LIKNKESGLAAKIIVIGGYDSFPQNRFYQEPKSILLRTGLILSVMACFFACVQTRAQEPGRRATISLFSGIMNYQGDLNPHSFTVNHSSFATGLIIRKPVNRWFNARVSLLVGRLTAADRWNREYLRPRNLSFTTTLMETTLALEVNLTDQEIARFIPFLYGGITYFRYNPWAYDQAGVKTYLKPLSTEGQGLKEYPEQKPYTLTQWALPFGGGFKYAFTPGFIMGIDFSQRKTFTDYLDDVSSHYVDAAVLEAAKGRKAVEMAYRGDEIPGGRPDLPEEGDQRGTPSEMDWYYYLGLTFEMKLHQVDDLWHDLFSGRRMQACPVF